MELDISLLNTIIQSHRDGGPPPSCEVKTPEVYRCHEFMTLILFITTQIRPEFIDPKILTGISAAVQIGMELGLAYAELKGVKQ